MKIGDLYKVIIVIKFDKQNHFNRMLQLSTYFRGVHVVVQYPYFELSSLLELCLKVLIFISDKLPTI